MYHQYRKDSSHVRQAIFKAYDGKCQYCGIQMQMRHMHIDHIVPQNADQTMEQDVIQYLAELTNNGFILDSIENYLPACSACNRKKSNTLYLANNLRYYHEIAKKHTQDILRIIEEDTSDEQLFEPVNSDIWEEVTFANQHDISNAIMGYRLGPSDVAVCPRIPQVTEIVKRLSIVDYVIVQGEAGCGKSISVYQAAFDYYKKGWKIYRYKESKDQCEIRIPNNSEESLYIIDDAQRLDSNEVYELSEQARLNRKLVFAKTISGSYQFDTILITNEDAVNVLYKSYLSRKEEILPIVHRCDSDVGSDFFTQPYARRLDSAKKASTPWQFNYILRGGWNTVRTLYLSTCPQQRQRLLASAIAAFQILLLDNCVDYNWLCDFFRNIEYSVSWTRTDLLHLVSNRIVLSEDDPRIIHIESAKVILAQFLEGSTPEQAKPLYTAIEKAVVDGIVSPLGLVWIYNGLSSHLIIEIYSSYLITQRMIAFICGNLQGITTPKARMELAFFLDRVFTYKYEKNGFWYFKNNLQLLTAWISESNGETAYAYSRLINSLYNHDKELHHAFSGKINWHTLFTSLAKENGRHLYSWGQLINRLVISLSQVERDTLSIQLETAINMLLTSVTSRNIDEMSSFLASVAYLIPHLIPEIIKTLLPRYKERFIEDASNILYIFDFNFLLYVCGLSLLGGHRATEDEKETSRMLISSIPEKELGKLIANCEPRLWDQFYDVMILVSAYSQEKARKIVENIDLELLSSRATDYWNREHSDVFPLCLSLHLGSRKIAKQFISMNANRILHFSIYYVFVAPTCAIQAFHEGKPVDIISDHNWRLAYFSFKGLLDVDKQTANEILVTNLKRICSEVNELAEVDFEDVYCIKFFRLVQKSNTYSFARILAGLNLERIATHWPKRISFQKTNRGRKKRYRTFLDYLCNLETPVGVREVLEEIRNDLDRNVSSNDYR